MFNTLVYIPTILAYTFITLLVVILGFIVIYVAHKIYTTLYDYLPVAQLSSKSLPSNQMETMTKTNNNLLGLGTKADGQVTRKSKTALRIIVTLEPCYLAYMVFESKLPHTSVHSSKSYQYSYSSSSINSSITDSQEYIKTNNDHLLIKYFDSLSAIPTIRDLHKCDNFKLNNVCCIRRRRK